MSGTKAAAGCKRRMGPLKELQCPTELLARFSKHEQNEMRKNCFIVDLMIFHKRYSQKSNL